jgi:hypothetical protein
MAHTYANPASRDRGAAQDGFCKDQSCVNSETVRFKQADTGRDLLSTVPRLQSPSRPEESDDYLAVAVLNSKWRVIECSGRIQWILQGRRGQRHGRPRWEGRSYCSTREALLRCARLHAGDIAPDALVVLLRLPARIGGAP